MNEKENISKEIQEELAELAPTLAKLSKKNIYAVPEGYFKNAQDQASNMATQLGIQKPTVTRRMIYVRSAAVAASVVILAILVWMNYAPGREQQLAANEVSIDEMIEYLETESSVGIEEEYLVDELIDVEMDVAADALGEEIDQVEDEAPTAEEIIEYLLEDNIDLATIIDELN